MPAGTCRFLLRVHVGRRLSLSFLSCYAEMPGIVRRLVIFAIADGLILQPHGSHYEQPQALRLEWKTARVTPWKTTAFEQYQDKPYMESHGIVGKAPHVHHSYAAIEPERVVIDLQQVFLVSLLLLS